MNLDFDLILTSCKVQYLFQIKVRSSKTLNSVQSQYSHSVLFPQTHYCSSKLSDICFLWSYLNLDLSGFALLDLTV